MHQLEDTEGQKLRYGGGLKGINALLIRPAEEENKEVKEKAMSFELESKRTSMFTNGGQETAK